MSQQRLLFYRRACRVRLGPAAASRRLRVQRLHLCLAPKPAEGWLSHCAVQAGRSRWRFSCRPFSCPDSEPCFSREGHFPCVS